MLPLAKQNRYRERYQRLQSGWQTSGEELEALVRKCLTSDTYVLDLGCGRGGVMELFWHDVQVAIGLDPDVASLIEHRTLMPLTCGLGGALPFPSETFHLVIGLWVLEHLRQPEKTLSEIQRVLRPGGHFIFLTPNAQHPLIWANQVSHALPLLQRRLIPKLYGRDEADTFRVHYRANTPARLRGLAALCGLHINSLRAIPDPTYLAFNDFFFHLSILLERCLPPSWGVHLLGDFVKI
jgi:SAM-dependent methyltransferase